MTYIVDITLALTRVLESAAFFRDERLAGYAANAAFWADEVRHALDVIDGHDARIMAWNNAVTSGVDPIVPIRAEDLAKLKIGLKSAATRFFRICRKHLDRSQVVEIEQLLDIRIEQRPKWD